VSPVGSPYTAYNLKILINESHIIKDLVEIIICKIVNNYRLLDEFINDKRTIFVLQFFTIFITKLKVNNNLSIVFHL